MYNKFYLKLSFKLDFIMKIVEKQFVKKIDRH